MRYDALRLELIEWLMKLDPETIEYLKSVKYSKSNKQDWWHDVSLENKQGIERGLEDVKLGRTVAHDEVVKKYGL